MLAGPLARDDVKPPKTFVCMYKEASGLNKGQDY